MRTHKHGAPFVCLMALLIVLASSGEPAEAGRFDSKTAQANTPSSLASNQHGVIARVYYAGQAELAELAAQLDVWEVHPEEGYLLALLSPDEEQELLQAGYRVVVDETRTAELNAAHPALPGQTSGIPGFPCYRTVTETYASAQAIALAHPDLAHWTSIGPSWEKANLPAPAGFDLMLLQLTNSAVPGPKPRLFIMASMHAREYAPAELLTRFGEYLVDHFGSDPDVTWLLDYREIDLLLQANPDGRIQAEKGEYWRKNTDRNYCSATPSNWGADLNRNYPFQWGLPNDLGSSSNPCDETYRGPQAASEPETRDVINFLRSQFPDLRPDDLTSPAPADTSGLFIDLHSYGNLLLWPWGWTNAPAPNAPEIQTLGRKMAFLNALYPEQSDSLYPTDGTTDDYAYGELGLAAYTFEIGTAFFQDCPTFENTILPQDLPSLIYAAKAAARPYQEPGGSDMASITVTPTLAMNGSTIQIQAIADDTRSSTANGSETIRDILGAEYFIDTPPWITTALPVSHPLFALDGSYDQATEAVGASLDTTGLSQGRHTLFLRSQDSRGQWGLTSAAFIYIGNSCTAITGIHIGAGPTPKVASEPAGFSVGFQPYWSTEPYTYTVDFGDGSASSPIPSTTREQTITHTYGLPGIYPLQVRAWNCNLAAGQGITSTLEIQVFQRQYLYLPIIQ
jgi:carboxypeptidase T